MKKSQKRLGNKGFSLVELIVVIAIMAVLVGVLAPTLIRNVEKSRESSDVQTLDSIRGSVTTALSIESVNSVVNGTEQTIKYTDIASTASAGSVAKALYDEMNQDGTTGATMKSSSGKGGDIYVHISTSGKVSVYVTKTDKGAPATAETASKSGVKLLAE